MKSKIRKLEADLKRSEKDRQRENVRHADELKSNNEDNAAKVAELDRHFGELKPKHEQALVAEKLQGVEEGKKLTRDERDAEVKSSETTIENLKREDEARMSRVKKSATKSTECKQNLIKLPRRTKSRPARLLSSIGDIQDFSEISAGPDARADSLQLEVDSLTAKIESWRKQSSN